MRLAAFAVASLLIVVAIPSAPVVEAASTQVHGFIYAYQNVGDTSTTVVTPSIPHWSCSTTDTSVAPALDITVDCHGVVQSNGAGYCYGAFVNGQAGTTGTSTFMEVSGLCGPSSADIAFTTPNAGINAAVLGDFSFDFSCAIHIDNAAAAQPWSAFCQTA